MYGAAPRPDGRPTIRAVSAVDPEARVEELLGRLGVRPDSPTAGEARTLVAQVVELGATDAEVLAAGRRAALGPLALDLVLRRPGPTRTVDELLTGSSHPEALVRELWRALGLPEHGEPEVPVPPDLVEAIDVLCLLLPALGDRAVIGLARVIGSSTSRMADTLANSMRVGVEVRQLDEGTPYSQVMEQMWSSARELLPVLWDAVGAVFRRHLVLVSYESWTADDARRAVTIRRTIGFVDLVGSTDVLRTLSVSELAAAIDRFEQLIWDVVSGAGGRVLKLIGDEAMFVTDDPAAGCRVAQALLDGAGDRVRVGLAHGEMVAYHGDCYGPTVNLAARLVEAAAPGTALVSEAAARAVAGDGAVVLDPVSTGPLRGFPETTTAYRIAAP